MNQRHLRALVATGSLFSLAALFSPAPAHAGVLNDLQGQYQGATNAWLGAALGWARVIFAGLVVLELTWSVLEIFLRNRDLDSFVNSLVIRIISIGAAIFVLSVAGSIVLPLIDDFTNIGASIAGASGVTVATTPDDVLGTGFTLASDMMNSNNNQGWQAQLLALLPQIIGAFAVLLAFAVVAGQLLLTKIQIFIVVGGGAFLLGFLGSRWTLPFAERYPSMVIASGLKLVVIVLIVGLGQILEPRWAAVFATPQPPIQYLSVGASAVIYALIAWNIPAFIAAMAGTSPALSFSALVAGSASLAARAAAGGASGGAAGAAGAAGGAAAGGGIGAIERAAQTN